jgi:hypothetical protein
MSFASREFAGWRSGQPPVVNVKTMSELPLLQSGSDFLRRVQVLLAGREVAARVRHAAVQPEGVEVVAHVVVIPDGGGVAALEMESVMSWATEGRAAVAARVMLAARATVVDQVMGPVPGRKLP